MAHTNNMKSKKVKDKKSKKLSGWGKIRNYGDCADWDDDTLVEAREELMDYLEKGKTQAFINRLHALQEVERELTLREDR